jgi:NAD(P)-dependent dehydrogenase (short-subunit alcohol dehydrogenase family)
MVGDHEQQGAPTTTRARIIAVTGAASGIGAQVAVDLAASGHLVWCLDREQSGLDATLARIRKVGSGEALALDVTDESQVIAVFQTIGQHSDGRLDGLVNSAGVVVVGPFEQLEVADWQRAFTVNVIGSFLTIKYASRLLRAAAPGMVVNLASIAARSPSLFTAPYNASKAAVLSLTRSAAVALAPGILVNSVSPGPIGTPMYQTIDDGLDAAGAPPELHFGMRSTMNPLGRAGTTAEVSAAILFLLSDAARFMTGQDISVNGGMLMP